MKSIVNFHSVPAQGTITLDYNNPMFQFGESTPEQYAEYLNQVFNNCIPYTQLFENIIVENFNTLPSNLLSRLINQYLHGASIHIINSKHSFDKVYKLHYKAPKFYVYKFEELDLSKPIPKSLANFEFKYKGKQTTYLEAIRTLSNPHYLPNEIWKALDDYSKQRINKCREYNRGDYSVAEQWLKALMHDCIDHDIKMFSPNKKTYYEVTAENNFEQACINVRLTKDEQPLTPEQLAFLHKYASAYGVDIPTFQWRINTRKTDHGYTEEPEQLLNGMSNSDYNRIIFDPRNTNNLPKNIRKGLYAHECQCDKYLISAYKQLVWIMDNLKDDGLMPGYKRCSVCGEIYLETQGCGCGYCKPIDFINADNMLYGISSTYEDYSATKETYMDLDNEDEELVFN